MITINTTVQLKSCLPGVPFRACGKVVAVYETGNAYKVKFPQGEFDVPADQVVVAHKHHTTPENVPQIKEWLRTRGGLAIWNSLNFSDPLKSWTCPVNDAHGQPTSKQHWEMGQITRIITDPEEVVVEVPKEVKRFHVAVRRGSQGMSFKLTDGSSKRVREAVRKASEESGKDAWYAFDYSTQECLIFVADAVTPLSEWADTDHE